MKLSRKLAALAATGLLAAGLAVPATSASADGPQCNLSTHCYGIAHYPSGNIDAVGLDLWTDCLHLDTPLTDVATHEMWMHTNAAPPATTWLEAGYLRGIVAGGDPQNWFRWTWAEHTGSNFYSHYIQNASVAQWKNLTFSHNANHTWGVYLGGVWVGTTAQTATLGTFVQVGAETTEPLVYSHGKSRNLQWHPPGGSWSWATSGIVGATSGVYSVSASGAGMEQTSLQRMCAAPLAAKQAAKAPTEADLKKMALSVAVAHGEQAPTGIETVSTTRKAAQRAVGAGTVESDQATYLVQMKGSFVGRAPQGAKLPRGNTMTVTVDAKTGEVTDTSLGADRQDLKKLGSVKTL